MKVVCKNNDYCVKGTSNSVTLTEGKVYDVIDCDYNGNYKISNDAGNIFTYHKSRFLTIDEYRDKKLNFLLKDSNEPSRST